MQIFRRRSKKNTPPREAPKQTSRRAPELKDVDNSFESGSFHDWQGRFLDPGRDSGESPLESEIRTDTGFLHKQELKGDAQPFFAGDLATSYSQQEHLRSKGKDSTYSSKSPESLLDCGGSDNLAPSESSKAESYRAARSESFPLSEIRQEIQQAFERASSAALVWLNAHAKEINEDGKLNSSLLSFSEFLDCAFTLYQAGKTGWHAESPADHFASAIDQAGDPAFREDLIRQLLLRHHTMDHNDPAEMDASTSGLGSLASASSSAHTLLPAISERPPHSSIAAPLSKPLVTNREEAGVPSLFAKDIFLDWHSKFAFSEPVRLASKEVLPTIVLPALAASDQGDISTVEKSQERQSLLDELVVEQPSGSEMERFSEGETPHFETYQPHPGLLKLGSSLYTSQFLSDSPLNMPRQAQARLSSAPPRRTASTSPPLLQVQDMQLFDNADESYAIYGSGNLQKAILDGDIDTHALIDQARYEEENPIHLLAPMVHSAVLEGKYDVVIQLAQRNIKCIDVALQTAEETGKFSLVKYLDLWKQCFAPFAGSGGRRSTPLSGHHIGPSTPVGRSSPDHAPRLGSGTLAQSSDILPGYEDDSEEVWKLRAIYLLLLMIVLSETAEVSHTWDNGDGGHGMSETSSSQGWNSGSSTSSRQSSQAPVDAQVGDYTAGGTGFSGFTGRSNSGTPSGSRRPVSDNNRKKKSEDDDSDGSDGNRRPRNRRPSNLRSLGRRYACPFAKADPDNHVTCWTINRQNLAGVKEHMKRFHFRGTLPADIRAARTWDDVFDCIAPDWGSKPRPSAYVDMLDIFQRAVRPARTSRVPGPASTSGSASGVVSPQPPFSPSGQWANLPQQIQQPLNPQLPPQNLATDYASNQALGFFGPAYVPASQDPNAAAMFYNQMQPQAPDLSRATSPASASVAGLDAGNYGMLSLGQMANTGAGATGLAAVAAPQTTLSPFEFQNMGNGLPFDDLIRELTGSDIAGSSPQDIRGQFQQAGDWFYSEFDIDNRRSAESQWMQIMDAMETPAPVQILPPVFESSPEPASAVSNDTITTGSFYQHFPPPQSRQTATSPPSVVSSASGASNSLRSVYPPSSTSMGIHNIMAGTAPQMTLQASSISAPPVNSTTTNTPLPIATYLGSSPASTVGTAGSKDKRYQLLISRNPAVPYSTEKPGHRKFSFDTFEEFLRNFDAFMQSEFNEPLFEWGNWELLNPKSKLRLSNTEDVMNDLDFTFVAFDKQRAALWLVPKEV
ncbi:hypothetical protein ABW21_db0206332 [Orbilia brochopaga]|nr:hypothetical protein ABW21_db0206332 [Drechslerella brochopaga]